MQWHNTHLNLQVWRTRNSVPHFLESQAFIETVTSNKNVILKNVGTTAIKSIDAVNGHLCPAD
jgi:hypothetical protein